MKKSHLFAVYLHELSHHLKHAEAGKQIVIHNAEVLHRLKNVLRLQIGDRVVLFDFTHSAQVELSMYDGKKSVSVRIVEHAPHKQLQPFLTIVLPLLKREALETALYACVELGAQEIRLVTTHKVQNTWRADKDLERMRQVMIAAAEQSKQFALPALYAPVALEHLLSNGHISGDHYIYADPAGIPLLNMMQRLHRDAVQRCVLMVGPEGDLTDQEKELLQEYNFTFCALTPTVLRAWQALSVLLGSVRSMWP